jgi:cytochrome c oxidase subunit 2
MRASVLLAFCLLLTGCAGNASALEPAGPQAGRLFSLWWLFFWVCSAVWLIVSATLIHALLRRRSEGEPDRSPGAHRTILVATVVTTAILLGFLVASVVTGRAMASLPANNALNIEVTGYQWWWKVNYPDFRPDQQVTTANEIHIPTERPIRFVLTS